MRNLLLLCVLTLLIICPARPSYAGPTLRELKLVAQLPAELPQRVLGLAYDGEKLWTTVYLSRGHYAKLDPSTLEWTISDQKKQHDAISKVAGSFVSPGGICFVNGKLWIAGMYGDSFGSIDMNDWKVERLFKVKQRDSYGSQSYASMTYDGSHLWIAWHWFRYDLPTSETQVLLKVDPETGNVVARYPLPGGTRNDGTHALTWDGARLWHAKDNRLSAIDPSTGRVTAEYTLNDLKRPSGLAWDGQSLWIAEFDGKIWRLQV